ncbi:hypothetical protein PAMA_020628 [Pampus argenteus]
MDFMKLFGTVVAVFFHPGSAFNINDQRICRRGTERPCYKVSYIQDSRRRLTFEDARRACRSDGGELLSIETEMEQQLIERFIRQLQATDGDFWIGLRRNLESFRAGTTSLGCPSQYYWLDGSKAKFRHWHWDEPSCGSEMCVALYYQPSAPPEHNGHFLFQWNDDKCNSTNNYICKYPEENIPAFTEKGNKAYAENVPAFTKKGNTAYAGPTESSVSFSDNNTLHVSYTLYATIATIHTLLLLFALAGFFYYKQHAKRRKTETESDTSRMSTAPSSCLVQGALSDMTNLPRTASHCSGNSAAGNMDSDNESGFVTNDIYETCRAQGRDSNSHAGWVDNDIYA